MVRNVIINLFEEDLDKTKDLKVGIKVANKEEYSGLNERNIERITLGSVELSLRGVTNVEKNNISLKNAQNRRMSRGGKNLRRLMLRFLPLQK